jgi:hypothetical protein
MIVSAHSYEQPSTSKNSGMDLRSESHKLETLLSVQVYLLKPEMSLKKVYTTIPA